MSSPRLLRRGVNQVIDNATDIGWWYRRVFVPYVVGTLSRFVPWYPGYDEAIEVMQEDWDNLIVLDACRADVFEAVSDLDRFDTYSREISLGSHSSEWTRRNFAGRRFGDTVYVTGNPHTKLLAGDSFHDIIEVRSPSEVENWMSAIVDATATAHEKYPDKRLIIHFMQPHTPIHVDTDVRELATDERWRQYRESLERVLEQAFEVFETVGGKTVITADHGETYDRRLLGVVKIQPHPPRVRLPELVEVPWATLFDDRRGITSGGTHRMAVDNDVDERLRQLGYKV